MKNIRFFTAYTVHSLAKLCQRRWLLAGLALLCLLLSLGVGPAMKAMLSDGVSFSGLTLAVVAPAGDSTPEAVVAYASKLEDIEAYCTFRAMSEPQALAAMEDGEVTAVLLLPENFVEGILYGTNPDVRLLVPADQPLESLLTLWVGQSATNLLAAVQSGVYGVLSYYDTVPDPILSRNRVMTEINLKYISWSLNRQELFRTETVEATGTLPVGLHYGLSLLSYCGLTAAPLFTALYDRPRLVYRRRLRALGRGSGSLFVCDVTAGTVLLFLLMIAPACVLSGGNYGLTAAMTAICALFCAVFGLFCCQLTPDAAACGGLSFFLALVLTALGGGILPPVLLPETLRNLSWLSPVSWLRTLLSVPAGHTPELRMSVAMAVLTLLLAAAALTLSRRRVMKQEAAE